ncbi:hypothetical protein O6P43_026992 [Quillaja saponaria]|uniref:Uncharacterized protein n=1 Tax=Quillaja saponaria TaxID=32244 RepID=A0AAD7L3K4_QUISA|nr:hypothetical protein O6P43_026992 [Quillaja saponaria]
MSSSNQHEKKQVSVVAQGGQVGRRFEQDAGTVEYNQSCTDPVPAGLTISYSQLLGHSCTDEADWSGYVMCTKPCMDQVHAGLTISYSQLLGHSCTDKAGWSMKSVPILEQSCKDEAGWSMKSVPILEQSCTDEGFEQPLLTSPNQQRNDEPRRLENHPSLLKNRCLIL